MQDCADRAFLVQPQGAARVSWARDRVIDATELMLASNVRQASQAGAETLAKLAQGGPCDGLFGRSGTDHGVCRQSCGRSRRTSQLS